MILAYITCKDEGEAINISRHLLNKKLAACANIFPIKSMYWWQGKIENSDEAVLIAKTVDKNFNKIKNEVKKIHSYEIPCILKINAEADEKYMKWVKESCGNSGQK